ncbi:MAG: hypothetical protein MPF33_01850 [Candidatus Aramenus sp.]|jgi:hypothetical protein|nr:hypothetical protein [Candidatus Aramenus sp.]
MINLIKKIISGVFAGALEVAFYSNDLGVFAYLSLKVLKLDSMPLGILLHLFASAVVFVVAVTLLEAVNIRVQSLAGAVVLGIMLGSSVLSLFSLPVHLLLIPLAFNLTYVASHVFYGLIAYLTYYITTRG